MKKLIKSLVLVIAGLIAGIMIIPVLANTPLFTQSTNNQMITEQEAIDIALNNTSETLEVVKIELDDYDDDADQEYEIVLQNESRKVEVEIDAYTGEIKKWEVEMFTVNNQLQSIINLDKAKEIALEKAGAGFVVVSVKLDNDDKEYELELHSDRFEIEVELDAYSGQITKWEAEAIKGSANQESNNSQTAMISREKAIEIALNKAGSGFVVIEVELDDDDDDDDDDTPEYEIELRSSTQEIEVEINAYTGQIMEWEVETLQTSSPNTPMISRERAIAIAREKIGSDPVLEEIELDDDDNTMIYELEFEHGDKEYEFEIDAYTGQIIEFEIDD